MTLRPILRETQTPLLPPVPPPFIYDVGRAITTLIKIYDDKSKYYSAEDVLDTKVIIFYDLCLKAGVWEAN
jgi:hypothetical protein